MYGFEIIQELASVLSGNELIVSSNGNISRQSEKLIMNHKQVTIV